MSSNVGLSTPRGSGTSGYVQRNAAFIKPRTTGYGQPYPPVSGANSAIEGGRPFKQRMPDQQILEHDRRRAVEVKVMELREELEEENERLEEEEAKEKAKGKKAAAAGKNEEKMGEKEEGEEGEEKDQDSRKDRRRVLSEEEIDERCEELRARLLKDLEVEERRAAERKERDGRGGGGGGGGGYNGGRRWGRERDMPPPSRKQFKSYQVHELAEAKIEESERLRRALGIREDRETGEISGGRRRD
ncbi:U2-type spliceosomal complex subunit CWC21 [Aspergillus saccharolyticus JOP 1030-1]|uniref:CWF21 domain-containing protein n=1 Tax=Aspergillus saccharolyticus JOP 1030-1 TaxID=1450539 RepID=A0A318ZL27_9EURO|nr:hypothetical protein BP01DRAFT_421303 [Aspergillus saccharolyticus JOP 1030-1]PYH48206.1 hypothetical protein BP01DRAFT_421303 [Aspergillus saccharolyticus JOP 1030-1]